MNDKVINPARPFEPLEPYQDVQAAADAGPRQPEPRPKNWKMASRSDYQKCEVCGTRWFANEKLPCPRCSNVTAREEKDDLLEKAPETLPNGNFVWCCKGTDVHEEHCVYHSPFQLQAAPVPQEAAPRECDCEECASRLATAPDSAMRVAREFVESRLIAPFLHGDEKHQEWLREETRKWIPDLAALIRQAGSQSREPDGWAHRYHNCIRFNQGQEVNGEKPSEAVPYWLGTPGQAGSERERKLEMLIVHMQIHSGYERNGYQQMTTPQKALYDEIEAEASRLLGGESNAATK